MLNPVSTYRLQFHKGFTFKDFKSIIPYLEKLGIKTIYAAPIFAATPGSMHGYDGVNSHKINPEIGTEEELKSISKELKEKGIAWLQDIVPNHMAFHSDNPWLMDVLEKGKHSLYHPFFDIDWNSDLYKGRVMVPFLGAPIEEVIKNGEITITYTHGKLAFNYYDQTYPLNPVSYISVLGKDDAHEDVRRITERIEQLQEEENKDNYKTRWDDLTKELADLLTREDLASYLKNRLKDVNADHERLQYISNQQVYQLCYWQETDYQINYRRFFTINGLICLNVQNTKVCAHYHEYIKFLVNKEIIQGIRVDHVDGLYDPTAYLDDLREIVGKETYVTVEKILEPGETLPENWSVQGNTGYDFLGQVNNLLTNKNSKEQFTDFYESLTHDSTSIHQQIRDKKALILYSAMAGELDNLTKLFKESGLVPKESIYELSSDDLKKAIGELLIQCPVYRFYGNKFPLSKEEQDAIHDILMRIEESNPELIAATSLLQLALLRHPDDHDELYNNRALKFYQRLMQFSGPLMAKGVEDTLMYTYNRFIGNNEVGDSPETFGMSTITFHKNMKYRQANWPLSINATATHDTKRGEDASARLNVLTDLPDEWIEAVSEWKILNQGLKTNDYPDANDEYFIYQALVSTYPFNSDDNYEERLHAYISKALREAKIYSNWNTPNEEYETAAKNFASGLLDKSKPFWKSFKNFHDKISDHGIINSLTKVLLKFTCPGVPDVYQGCELWDFNMVDPDNRRPVNYQQRIEWLDKISKEKKEQQNELLKLLWDNRTSGNIKLWLIHNLLNERKENQELFHEGHYVPLQVKGTYKKNVIAFARRHKETWYVVASALHTAALCKKQGKEISEIDWENTRIVLPEEAPENWDGLLHKVSGKNKKGIEVGQIFKDLPLALIKMQHAATSRSAGILMHITSLPSPFGIGDFGPEAKLFANFLSRSRQKYWQLLPLNITEAGNAHSPYSSISSMAGNTLLISPEGLAKDGLLDAQEIKQFHLPSAVVADFAEAERIKDLMFEKAYQKFISQGASALTLEFKNFCKSEAHWLHDFALYVRIKRHYHGNAWYKWPEALKLRDEQALNEFAENHEDALNKIKWLQFMFARQWKSLKRYCNNLGIQLFGDLPFYVSYDSADVWSNPDIFALDEKGNITGVAGVPPDYFNSDGQLWGMPVFKWDVLKKRNYDWWIQRIKKNMEFYDVLRLDHFRAFADYWEVAAKEKTAKKGTWKPGPGADFFHAIKNALGELPFIAEDLGDINDEVHKLRDDFNLPGMKVLQFAFGDDMSSSIYISHNYNSNYLAYTGTHDNNTTVGWFRQDAGKTERKNLYRYLGIKPKEKNIHTLLSKLAYSSVAKTAIIPLQDLLGLDENSRMNIPASMDKNWVWRLKRKQLTEEHEELLREWVKMYNR